MQASSREWGRTYVGSEQQFMNSTGPVAILWDMENCPIPGNANVQNVAGNIRRALRFEAASRGAVTLFSAYSDFSHSPKEVREGCQRSGINLIDVPNHRKDASDVAILVDMFFFATDNPPPCTIMLISGDIDFAAALHKLGQRGYNIVLAVPTTVRVSPFLCNAGEYVWNWNSIACGDWEGLVSKPASKWTSCNGIQSGINLVPESCIVSSEVSLANINTLSNASDMTQPSPEIRFHQIEEQERDGNVEEYGDIEGLKFQLMKLLYFHGGTLQFGRIGNEYTKCFRQNIFLADYGYEKLASLLKKMGDAFYVKGEGMEKTLHLTEAGLKYANLQSQAQNRKVHQIQKTKRNCYRKVWRIKSSTCAIKLESNPIQQNCNTEENGKRKEISSTYAAKPSCEEEDVHPSKRRKVFWIKFGDN